MVKFLMPIVKLAMLIVKFEMWMVFYIILSAKNQRSIYSQTIHIYFWKYLITLIEIEKLFINSKVNKMFADIMPIGNYINFC